MRWKDQRSVFIADERVWRRRRVTELAVAICVTTSNAAANGDAAAAFVSAVSRGAKLLLMLVLLVGELSKASLQLNVGVARRLQLAIHAFQCCTCDKYTYPRGIHCTLLCDMSR